MPKTPALIAATLALPAFAHTLPPEILGSWDVSAEACAAHGASVTRIDVAPGRIDTYGGNALVREVARIGAATFAAADFEQTEGAAEIAPRTREHFRFSQREGRNRMRFVWKDVKAVDLIRCDAAVAPPSTALSPAASDPRILTPDGEPPAPLGLRVIAGKCCGSPPSQAGASMTARACAPRGPQLGWRVGQ